MPEKDKKKSFGLFGKAKSEAQISGDRPQMVRKSQSFKRIRGFLNKKKGRKNKEKERKKAEETQLSTKTSGDEEDSTVFGVDVDERSLLKETESSPKKAAASLLDGKSKDDSALFAEEKKSFLLKVVLLLMDPETRRFELLQIEFDSLKALVLDVLAQIPVSATEEALRKQTYTGICKHNGKDMVESKLLAEFCKGDKVLVAIPTDVPAKECA